MAPAVSRREVGAYMRAHAGGKRITETASGEREWYRAFVRLDIVRLHDVAHAREKIGTGGEGIRGWAEMDKLAASVACERQTERIWYAASAARNGRQYAVRSFGLEGVERVLGVTLGYVVERFVLARPTEEEQLQNPVHLRRRCSRSLGPQPGYECGSRRAVRKGSKQTASIHVGPI